MKMPSFIKRLLLPIGVFSGKMVLRLLLSTCRIEVQGLEHFLDQAKKGACILMLWHNRLPIVAELLRRLAPQFTYAAFVSHSRDGQILAALARSYKQGRAITVKHNARELALRTMITALTEHNQVVVITPDGPRGPIYQCKPGIVLAARKSQAPIIPFSWSSSDMYCLKSWDKMRFPYPFSRLKVTFSSAIMLDDHDAIAHDDQAKQLQEALNGICTKE